MDAVGILPARPLLGDESLADCYISGGLRTKKGIFAVIFILHLFRSTAQCPYTLP